MDLRKSGELRALSIGIKLVMGRIRALRGGGCRLCAVDTAARASAVRVRLRRCDTGRFAVATAVVQVLVTMLQIRLLWCIFGRRLCRYGYIVQDSAAMLQIRMHGAVSAVMSKRLHNR